MGFFSMIMIFTMFVDFLGYKRFLEQMFCPIFRFWFSVTFGDEVTEILGNLCLHFARQDGQDGTKPERKSHN